MDCFAIAVKADVGNATEVEHLFDETVKAFNSVDVVINNSGIMSLAPIDNVIQTNFKAQPSTEVQK